MLSDDPGPIRSCWLSWLAVRAANREDVASFLGLTNLAETSWAAAAELADDLAHRRDGRYDQVLITPPVRGWVLIVGPWCQLPDLARTVHVTDVCVQASDRFGRAQAFFFGEQNDGDAWLIAEHGIVIRRWISEYPELALGEPFGLERRTLDAAGITARPEDLNRDDDGEARRLFTWDCDAPSVAGEVSLDPQQIGPDTVVTGPVMIARPPAPEARDPFAHSGRR